MLLCSCQGVLCGCHRVTLCTCKVFNMVFNITMWLLEYFGWLTGCYYAVPKIFFDVAKVFWVVARATSCNCKVFIIF